MTPGRRGCSGLSAYRVRTPGTIVGRLAAAGAAALFSGLLPMAAAAQPPDAPDAATDPRVRFRTGIELVNVSAVVTDRRGRFVDGLEHDDFRVYDDGAPQPIRHFSNERVPVSLGIVLDTSGSMEGIKMQSARAALNRFLFDLLGPEDEIFLVSFNADPDLEHDWTRDRDSLSRALGRIRPRGGTALYDAVAEAVAMAETGTHRKKAVVIISDGHDTNSDRPRRIVQRLIHESEVLVYAIGIDAGDDSGILIRRGPARPPIPFPIPGAGRGRGRLPPPTSWPGSRRRAGWDDRVNLAALRGLTDDSGGRTEVVGDPRDLDPATAGVADELSRQYTLAYQAPGHDDGEWHAIAVEVPETRYRVRARRGYIATP